MRAIERYRAFIDSASDGIVVLDGGGRGPLPEPRRRGGDRLRARRPGRASRSSQIVPEPFRATLETADRARRSPASRSTTSISSW